MRRSSSTILFLLPDGFTDCYLGVSVIGTLKGYDQLMNLVLDDVRELLRGMHPYHNSTLSAHSFSFPISPSRILPTNSITLLDENNNTTTRPLGLLVARGTLLVLISPLDGSEEIANPFNPGAEED